MLQANLNNRRQSKWTVKVYYIQDGNAIIISYLFPNTERKVVRTVEARCTGDIRYIIQIQRRRNYRRCSVCRLRAYVCKYLFEDKYFKFYRLSKREKYANDI